MRTAFKHWINTIKMIIDEFRAWSHTKNSIFPLSEEKEQIGRTQRTFNPFPGGTVVLTIQSNSVSTDKNIIYCTVRLSYELFIWIYNTWCMCKPTFIPICNRCIENSLFWQKYKRKNRCYILICFFLTFNSFNECNIVYVYNKLAQK